MPDVGQRVHVNVVVVQLLREGGATAFCKEDTQPATQVLGAAGLVN